jgi:cyclopropane-fatty-acyl-phospholipid synthase
MTDMSIAKTLTKQLSNSEKGRGFWAHVSDNWSRSLVLNLLKNLHVGSLIIEERGESVCFGDRSCDSNLHATLIIRDVSAYRHIALGGSIGAGEAYMQGLWDSPDLVKVVRVMARNLNLLNSVDRSRPWVGRLLSRIIHSGNRNSRKGSKRNISAHYDLGNDFFELFLDPALMYSSAVFTDKHCSLELAAQHKLELVCQKLDLSDTDHVLEIGTGWGGLAIYMAKHYGCRVTTTTLSREQFNYAQQAVRREGLEDRVTLLLHDYRDLTGQYDKLVSIEMIEAVGHQYYQTFFRQCSHLLKADGLMLIQAITIADQRYEQARQSVDFIQRYIFPGGSLPSNAVMAHHIARDTDMQICDLHDIGEDYAITLQHWHQRFISQLPRVKQQGFDEAFCRMWGFYLAYCEGGFRERAISTVQLLCAKPQARPENKPQQYYR